MTEGRTGRRGDTGREGPPGREGVEGHEGPAGQAGPRGYGVKRHRLLAAYTILALGFALALYLFQRHSDQRFEKADAISCQNRHILTLNQFLVVRYLRTYTHYGKDIDPVTGHPWAVEFDRARHWLMLARPCQTSG